MRGWDKGCFHSLLTAGWCTSDHRLPAQQWTVRFMPQLCLYYRSSTSIARSVQWPFVSSWLNHISQMLPSISLLCWYSLGYWPFPNRHDGSLGVVFFVFYHCYPIFYTLVTKLTMNHSSNDQHANKCFKHIITKIRFDMEEPGHLKHFNLWLHGHVTVC